MRRALLLGLVCVLLATPLLAVEGLEEHGGARVFGIPKSVVLLFNLVVFFGILAWFGGPAVVRFLEDKQRELQHALAEADRQRREAAAMEERIAAQVAALRAETAELSARAEREGERERQEILAEAERERERLLVSARAEIGQSLQQARQELTAHAAHLAARLAEERLAAGLTREDRKRLFRDNLARLERQRGA